MLWWFTQGVCALPAFLVIWSSGTFIISYIIAIVRHDVEIIFPYISDTGANPPESCIFGLMTFIVACAAMATIYARYKFVDKMNEDTRAVNQKLNLAALWIGLITCLGMCIVATFQETTMTIAHDIGAALFFVSGVLYIILQSVISYQAFPFGATITVCWTRALIASIAALAFFPTVICAGFVKRTDLHMKKDDPAYPFHVASAACEWTVAFSFVCFFLTYIHEFKMFTLEVITEHAERS
ncbi:DNA damage-regulated autophagy modulator protein 1 [Stegastes partitus]|uniref:DNA damage regulated autophagy modulator 1 n=1 Tax=Stegastes partitus TaxID=144197 RepID=A0A3B5BC52_9TELE|nr:PREDICTED: DNA damage-regulated autophagy modulator protein 1 [Stegastes partitus]